MTPKLIFIPNDDDYAPYVDFVYFYIYNNGPLALTIYSKNAYLKDYDSSYWDSRLVLTDEYKTYSYIQFNPSGEG
jgi:hypothetical protein